MDIDNEIARIKTRINAVQLANARAQVTKESAEKVYAQTMITLDQEFGVDSVPAVRDKLVELQTDLENKLTEVNAILEELEF